jgi:hypothetical protein
MKGINSEKKNTPRDIRIHKMIVTAKFKWNNLKHHTSLLQQVVWDALRFLQLGSLQRLLPLGYMTSVHFVFIYMLQPYSNPEMTEQTLLFLHLTANWSF